MDYGVVYIVKGPDYNAYMDAQQTLNLQLMREPAAPGVEFACLTRTVHVVPGNNVGAVVDADAADPVALHAQVRPALT